MAAKDLRGETNLTKCPAMGSKKAPCGTLASAAAHQARALSASRGLEVWGGRR